MPPPDTISRYGNIVAPSNEVAHPLKLKLPFPDVGEVKIPNPDQLNMREKLEQLAQLSDQEIRVQLNQWPAYSKMNLRDQGALLQRIQDFRDYRSNIARMKAHDMGLLTLTPDQQAKFEKDYWDLRLKMDRDLAKQFEPTFQAEQQKMQDQLFREFSSPTTGPIAAQPPATNKPAQTPPPAPPARTTTSSTAPNAPHPVGSSQPMAQSPH